MHVVWLLETCGFATLLRFVRDCMVCMDSRTYEREGNCRSDDGARISTHISCMGAATIILNSVSGPHVYQMTKSNY